MVCVQRCRKRGYDLFQSAILAIPARNHRENMKMGQLLTFGHCPSSYLYNCINTLSRVLVTNNAGYGLDERVYLLLIHTTNNDT
jgi:hypothetical protein